MTKNFYNDVYEESHTFKYGGDKNGMPKRTAKLQKKTSDWLKESGLAANPDAKILEIGCGMAYLSDIHPGWCGAEYSRTAVQRVKKRDGNHIRIFEEDAQQLSFPSESFDGVYTWAALEHVPNPNLALNEIDRILCKGGCALIAPAWNCRPWTVKKIVERPTKELSLIERLERCFIPLRELFLLRALLALPRRVFAEIKFLLKLDRQPLLNWKILKPRWDLIEKYGHVSDDDAVASIDPHSAIIFFKSRGYKIISHPNLFRRIISRHEPVVIEKLF